MPELLALLVRDEIESFPGLRPHQRPAWHAFLVQVGALALHKAGRNDLPNQAGDWEGLLRGLAGPDAETAWSLVVDDWTKPAFMQPPIPDPAIVADYKTRIETPDALDMLVTSKNHDLKADRMASAEPEHWVYALVTLQTFEGIMGAGKYGIARMNGGYGSRPMIGIEPTGRPGARFARDVARIPAARNAIKARFPGLGTRREIGLVWLEPWDGTRQLTPEDLDPLFVEVCRRFRLASMDGTIVALGGGSKAARIAWPKDLKGVTGDPWAPIDAAEDKVLSITGAGFSYRRLVDYLDPSHFTQPPLAVPDRADADRGLTISASALARGMGKTEGFHQRRVPVPKEVSPLFARGGINEFAKLGRARVDRVAEFSRRVLRPALFLAFQGGPDKPDYGKPTTGPQIEPWMRAFDRDIDRIFFDRVFDALAAAEQGDPKALEGEHRRWEIQVRDIARTVLERGIEAAPRQAMVRHRAAARARIYFDRNWKRILPDAARTDADERRTAAV